MNFSFHSPVVPYFVVALGLVIGSFINVVIVRLPQDQSLVRPGSRCPKCKKKIKWYDNIPVVSWLVLAGKCRFCKKEISPRYPLVEVLTALVFYAAYRKWGFDLVFLIRDLPLLAGMMAIVFIDLDHRIIPDELSIGGTVLALVTSFLMPGLGIILSLLGAAFGFGFFFALAWLYERRTGKVGLGGGDVKLLAAIGAFLGPLGVLTSILVSSVFGSVIGLLWGAIEKYGNRRSGKKVALLKTAIPFGPFLILGALTHYFFGEWLWHQYMTLT